MKIHLLPLGARFLFEGREYVKTGPMIGTGPEGARFFPKYQLLQPLDQPASAPTGAAEPLPRERVERALNDLLAQVASLVPEAQRPALEGARERFWEQLKA